MRVLIAGMDGYLGWPLAMHLAERGHEVAGFDNFSRRGAVAEIGSQSMTPIVNMENRLKAAKEVHGLGIRFGRGSTLDYGYLRDALKEFSPEAVVHLAEQPSAPYSMMDREHAVYTQQNNVLGTLNLLFEMKEYARDAQLVKLGTMGEYGTPNVAIPEGFFEIEYRGRKDTLPFPRQAGSWYHQCYDDQTEVLTRHGWKLFQDLETADEVATLNPNTMKMEFQNPRFRQRYRYKGVMYHQQNGRIDLCVTPNHRLVYYWGRRYPKLHFGEAEAMKGKPIHYVTAAPWDEGVDEAFFSLPECEYHQFYKGGGIKLARKIPMVNWLRFLGWYLAEGSVDAKPVGSEEHVSYRVALASDYRLDEAREVFREIGYDARLPSHALSGGQAVVNDKQLALYMRRFGHAADKYIPQEFKSLSRNLLSVLLQTMVDGDGHRHETGNGFVYHTTSKRLADDVQEIAVKCGYSADVSVARSREYRVNVTPCRDAQVNLADYSDRWVSYDGYVYCCTVANGTLFVRRNGRVCVSGNSKVHDTNNIMFACKIWGLRSTDIMQGVVYGTRTPEMTDERLLTRYDFDEVSGTAINRFCAQAAIGYPLSPYGTGHMKRGFIALVDSIQCMTLAVENPPKEGEYRVFNQLDEVYGIGELARKVAAVAKDKFGLSAKIEEIEDPRIEMQEHFYTVDNRHLKDLGFKPTRALTEELEIMLADCLRYKGRIEEKKEHIAPTITWREGRKRGGSLGGP